MRAYRNLFLLILLTALSAGNAAQTELRKMPGKKLIQFGWGWVTPQILAGNIKQMEENSPYDGVGICLFPSVMENGKSVMRDPRYMLGKTPWKYDDFKEEIRLLKSVKPTRFHHNFLRSTSRPGHIDWFDDKAWNVVCGNFSILSRIARDTGCKGIQFDMEDYSGGEWFTFKPELGHSFDETFEKARMRGRQWIDSIAKEYPDMTLFSFFWFSHASYMSLSCKDVRAAGPATSEGLFAAFLNGVYDNAPESMRFVDGNELFGYKSDDLNKFAIGLANYHRSMNAILTPENFHKARRISNVAVALYLDAYFPETPGRQNSWDLYPDADIEKRKFYLRRNLHYAMQYTDQYVWTWGERSRWWTPYQGNVKKLWQNRVPGINNIMRAATNPITYAEKLVKSHKLPNLVVNGNFRKAALSSRNNTGAEHAQSAVEGWSMWQKNPKGPGSFSIMQDKEKTGSSYGLLQKFTAAGSVVSQSFPAAGGDMYFVRGNVKAIGRGSANLNIFWKKGNTPWLWESFYSPYLVIAPNVPDAEGWQKFESVFLIPEGVEGLGLVVNIGKQRATEDAVLLDNFELYKLPLFNGKE